MHGVILDFAKRNRERLTGKILDVGALDVNGALSSVLPVTSRVDMRAGEGVDEVLSATQLLERYGPESWDSVVSAEMLEHAEDWRGCMNNIWGVLKPGGCLLLTMASMRKGRHAYPDDYWRFEFPRFLSLFGNNQILDKLEHKITIGVVVRKSADLCLEIEPFKVP